jgi:methylenetetrahydrofolate dehydrogenase (NADP+)/methenyltetrahydrofolate cyclohydrolase
MQLLDGLALSKTIKSEIKQTVSDRVDQGFKRPHLAAVLIGENGASVTYVNAKVKSCEDVGFDSTLVQLNQDCSEEEVLQTIQSLNENDTVDGYIIQLPLPKHINEKKVLMAVAPNKDVDGFHPESVGKMMIPPFLSTSAAC